MYLDILLGYVTNPKNEEMCKYYTKSEPFFALQIYDRQKQMFGISWILPYKKKIFKKRAKLKFFLDAQFFHFTW